MTQLVTRETELVIVWKVSLAGLDPGFYMSDLHQLKVAP